ncbi:MAG: 50S ribosome-binding GTPase [Candidatus Sabulitectum sp.]|nr:50S ribosome-binding GTPase [Candidatus Sabulitectum sp.]
MARVDRLVIGIFGRINAGKSTLMNLLTQQETSIVDSQPGTTADIKSSVMEIHSLGPVRILDTAGLDEASDLGGKKRKKALAALGEVDIALMVIDPVQAFISMQLKVEELISSMAARKGKRLAVVFNIRSDARSLLLNTGATVSEAKEFCRSVLPDRKNTPEFAADISLQEDYLSLIEFVVDSKPEGMVSVPLLPFLNPRSPVLMHIPLDAESPTGRLLRPQEMSMEYLLRMMVPVGLYRTDLALARSGSSLLSGREKDKFLKFLGALEQGSGGVQLVITDSQAIDVMSKWVPGWIPLTTFSIMMINQTAGGDMSLFAEGVRAMDTLTSASSVLIAEACNHDRIAEDIGTVQIPSKLKERYPGITVDHSFGREFPEACQLREYDLVIHCGGCMISRQKLSARIDHLAEAAVSLTNYGFALSWFEGPEVLSRVLEPWKVK